MAPPRRRVVADDRDVIRLSPGRNLADPGRGTYAILREVMHMLSTPVHSAGRAGPNERGAARRGGTARFSTRHSSPSRRLRLYPRATAESRPSANDVPVVHVFGRFAS